MTSRNDEVDGLRVLCLEPFERVLAARKVLYVVALRLEVEA